MNGNHFSTEVTIDDRIKEMFATENIYYENRDDIKQDLKERGYTLISEPTQSDEMSITLRKDGKVLSFFLWYGNLVGDVIYPNKCE